MPVSCKESKLVNYLQWKDHECVIVDVIWMEQRILTVPVPEKVKIRWETDNKHFEAWVSMNELKSINHYKGEWDDYNSEWID